MRTVVSANAQKAALAAARSIARKLRDAIAARGTATLALSGGGSAVALLTELARQPVDWSRVQVFQVDERIAPAGDAARSSMGSRVLRHGRRAILRAVRPRRPSTRPMR